MLIQDNRFGNLRMVALSLGRYENGNLALQGFLTDGEPWAKYSVNMGTPLPDDQIAIKDWSENEGVEDVLIYANIIEAEPICLLHNGFIEAPVYRLTPFALRELTFREPA